MINKKNLSISLAVIAGLVVYYLIILFTGYGIPCPFRKLTHLYCPGCGVSHMLMAMMKLNINQAISANAFMFFSFPVLIYLAVKAWLLWVLEEPYSNRFIMKRTDKILMYTYIAGIIAFNVYRNIVN